ncbi:MAG: macrocin O-methyltransferase [Mesorhizobium sp.]|nr:MAG: macrocin O-methyltransferase [Mesorhizobium sp.]
MIGLCQSGSESLVQNVLRRSVARILLGGREDRLIRVALASKFARYYAAENRTKLEHRFDLYRVIQERIGSQPIDYLEFGVFEGESIKVVSEINHHSQSRFIGFDSFEGLPRDWNEQKPRGTFSTDGNPPNINDTRVQFVKGWFNRTLPEFTKTFQSTGMTWIHIDCDLYSSAMCVLIYLDYLIKPGSFIVFDEFEDLTNEFRAFLDFQEISGKRFDVIGATEHFSQVAVQCVE